MPYIVECPNGSSFAQQLTTRGAWFYVYGRGKEAIPIYPDHHPESKRLVSLAKKRRYKLVGMLGLTPDGTILLFQTQHAPDRDLAALLAGAAFTADAVAGTPFPEPKPLDPADETAATAIDWLDDLFALEDPRTGDEADNA